MKLASEEQEQTTPITAGSKIQFIPHLLSATCNYRNFSESIASDHEIVHFYKEFMNRDLTAEDLEIVKVRLLDAKAEQVACGLTAPPTGRWRLGDGISENFQGRVRLCISEAGRSLPDYPQGTNTEHFWLHRLWVDLRANNSDLLFAHNDDGGMILSVCVASATFCDRLTQRHVYVAENTQNSDQPANLDPSPTEAAKGKRGPKPNKERHRKIAAVAKSYGDMWKDFLDKIADELDRQAIDTTKRWAKLSPIAKSWKRAVSHHRERVIKAIEYSLEQTAKDTL